jgi:uncharacterized protein YuzE
MKMEYDPQADGLYISLREIGDGQARHSDEIAPGCIIDFDENDQVIGIAILHARDNVELTSLAVLGLPVANLSLEAEKAA